MENIDENLMNSIDNWENQMRSSLSRSISRFDKEFNKLNRSSTCTTEDRSTISFRESSDSFNMRGSQGRLTRESDASPSSTYTIKQLGIINESTENDLSFSQNMRNSIQYGFKKRSTASPPKIIEKIEEEEVEVYLPKIITKTLITEKYKYIGETLENKKHGFGICTYLNGDKYIGYFNNDKKEGWGKYFVQSTSKQFYGEFKNNNIDGFVEYKNKQGLVHHGYMKNHKFVNKEAMTIISPNRYHFSGIMEFDPESNKLTGIATIKYSNGSIYQGETIESMENGWGILKRQDNFIFKGQKINCKYNGYCEIIYPDKSRYFGNFLENKRNGLGISFTPEGNYSIGQYLDDVKDGGFIQLNKQQNIKFELYLFGIITKTLEKMEHISNYTSMVYPEYCYLSKINHNYLLEMLSDSLE
jgi:hypothetical protein